MMDTSKCNGGENQVFGEDGKIYMVMSRNDDFTAYITKDNTHVHVVSTQRFNDAIRKKKKYEDKKKRRAKKIQKMNEKISKIRKMIRDDKRAIISRWLSESLAELQELEVKPGSNQQADA
uniref:Uncharacterized protein n=1 Tax=Sipha flava TaxID=143950 RepID=A0A2S2PXX8_9HEMI